MEKPVIKKQWKESIMEAMKGMRKAMKGISGRLMLSQLSKAVHGIGRLREPGEEKAPERA